MTDPTISALRASRSSRLWPWVCAEPAVMTTTVEPARSAVVPALRRTGAANVVTWAMSAAAEAADIAHVTTFAAPVRRRAGTTADLAGSTVVVMTAGSAQTQGQSRLDLLARNAEIVGSVIPEVFRHAPDTLLL